MTTRRMRNIDSEIVDTHTSCCSHVVCAQQICSCAIYETHTHAHTHRDTRIGNCVCVV